MNSINQSFKLRLNKHCSKNESVRPWYRAGDTQERNDKAKKAYEALMTVTLRKPTSPEYKNFSREVKKRAKGLYSNFTYDEEEVSAIFRNQKVALTLLKTMKCKCLETSF